MRRLVAGLAVIGAVLLLVAFTGYMAEREWAAVTEQHGCQVVGIERGTGFLAGDRIEYQCGR